MQAADLQLPGVIEQLGEAHRAVGARPVRRIVGLARLQRGHLLDLHPGTAEQVVAYRQRRGGLDQVVIVAAQHQQHFAVAVAWVVDHLQHRAVDLRKLLQVGEEGWAAVVGGKHDARCGLVATGRQAVVPHRESRLAPAGLAAEVGRQYRRRTLLSQARHATEHHRQFYFAGVARIEERQREIGQVVVQRQRLFVQLHLALAVKVKPQAAVRRVFADIGIVPDKLQTYPVEVAEQFRVQRQLATHTLAQLLFFHRNYAHQLVVEVDAQVRQVRQQGWRRRVVQLQAGIGGQAIATQAELNMLAVAYPQQQAVGRMSKLLEGFRNLPVWYRGCGYRRLGKRSYRSSSGALRQGGKQRHRQAPGTRGITSHHASRSTGFMEGIARGVRGQ
ncbi:hypothetical protein D9M71_252460 [compost metagenome]